MTQKTALITGITGQDGSLLANHLLNQGYKIIAPTRSNPDTKNLDKLSLIDPSDINYLSYSQWTDFDSIIKLHQPNEIYHLAAMSHVGESHKHPDKVFDVNTLWTLNILKAIEQFSPTSRLFFASSCEIFQSDLAGPADEKSNKLPTNPYGISKLAAHQLVQYYREVKNIYCCNGILFNHESELRDDSFVSKKICKQVAQIVSGNEAPLSLGNIHAKKDWGFAPDYIKIFQQIIQQGFAEDFVIATGVLHSVKDMVDASFNALNYPIYWQGEGLNCVAKNVKGDNVVTINKEYFRPLDDRYLVGNTSKLCKQIKINKLMSFNDWVKKMTVNEYEKLT